MFNPFSLEGKTILITGASSGIGRETAIECSQMGADVIITARNEERLKETLQLMSGDKNSYIVADLSKDEELYNLADQIKEVDGVVLNAGMNKLMPVQFIKEQDLIDIFRVNTMAPILLVQRLLKKKKINKKGSLVFTTSVSGNLTVTIANSLYSVSKAGLNAFMKNSAIELAAKGIRCNSVAPGMVNTSLITNRMFDEESVKADLKNYPLGRYGEPEDVAHGIIYLLSDAASWVTGTTLVIDGGLTLK